MDVGVYTFSTARDMPTGEFAREVEDRGFAALMLTEHSHIPAVDPGRRLLPGGARVAGAELGLAEALDALRRPQ